MMRDERPRPTAPKKACCNCGFAFDEAARDWKYCITEGGSVVCRNAMDCRLRQLNIKLGIGRERAEWLFFVCPRDRTRERMEIRPSNWKEVGWRASYGLPERVLNCILYHSWCYPVCLDYAVQLASTCQNPGRQAGGADLLCDQNGRFIPLHGRDIARILNEPWPEVSQALRRLKDISAIRDDQVHRLSPDTRLERADYGYEDLLRLWTPAAWQESLDAAFKAFIADDFKSILTEGRPEWVADPDTAELIAYSRAVCNEAKRRGFRPSAEAIAHLSKTHREVFDKCFQLFPVTRKLPALQECLMRMFDPDEIATWF